MPSLTPESIQFNRFLKLIVLEHKPLLACFGFVTRQKWLVSVKLNSRKRLNLIDSGVKSGLGTYETVAALSKSKSSNPLSLLRLRW